MKKGLFAFVLTTIVILCSYPEEKEDLEALIQQLTTAINENPGNAAYYFVRGTVYGEMGKLTDALADLKKTVALDPSARHYYYLSSAYLNLHMYDNALDACTQALRLNPTNTTYLSDRGMLYILLGDLQAALTDLNRSLELNNRYALSFYLRGEVYYAMKRLEEAIADFSRAIAINPKYTTAYIERASTYHQIGRLNDAIADYSIAILIQPENADVYRARADIYTVLAGKTEDIKQKAEYQRLAKEDLEAVEYLGGIK